MMVAKESVEPARDYRRHRFGLMEPGAGTRKSHPSTRPDLCQDGQPEYVRQCVSLPGNETPALNPRDALPRVNNGGACRHRLRCRGTRLHPLPTGEAATVACVWGKVEPEIRGSNEILGATRNPTSIQPSRPPPNARPQPPSESDFNDRPRGSGGSWLPGHRPFGLRHPGRLAGHRYSHPPG